MAIPEKSKRLEILAEIDILLKREEAGEDVAEELKACGKRLGFAGEKYAERKEKNYNEESVRIAKANGIPYYTFWKRIAHYGWSEHEACTIRPNQGKRSRVK